MNGESHVSQTATSVIEMWKPETEEGMKKGRQQQYSRISKAAQFNQELIN